MVHGQHELITQQILPSARHLWEESLGLYLTFAPRPGNTDAERNCITNVRPPEGLGYEAAAEKLLYLTGEALRRGISGAALKDGMAGLLQEGIPKKAG